jgi:hypothetical protein
MFLSTGTGTSGASCFCIPSAVSSMIAFASDWSRSISLERTAMRSSRDGGLVFNVDIGFKFFQFCERTIPLVLGFRQ